MAWKIGLAVSGGADSTALTFLLARLQQALGFEAVVLHVDHGIRTDSALDARFVRTLARRLNLPFYSTRVHIVRQAGESLEMAARRERLSFFAQMTRTLRLDAIATGHHADDVAETFLLRLARGSGPEGLAGLKRISRLTVDTPKGPLPLVFIRPLLDIRDAELKDYLRHLNEPWREDSTNTDLSIPRNKVRHLILPWLKANFDARMTEHICKTAAILRGDLTRTAALPAPAIETVPTPSTWQLAIAAATGFVRRPQTFGTFPAQAYLSRKALAGRTLVVRTWQAGDRMQPTGLAGQTRKLQDIFVTAKVPAAERHTLPLLADQMTGEILWVPGYRVAAAVAVETPHSPSWLFTLTRVGG